MPCRQTLPRLWLMTDERMGEALWRAIASLPRGAGIVFRHYATPPANRRRLFVRVARIARARGLIVLLAGTQRLRGAQGAHNACGAGIRSASVHSIAEARRARGCDLVFVSPVFATRSHPGAPALGPRRAAALARIANVPAIALGGMDAARFRRIAPLGFHGWAGIAAWAASARQKRKAVPI